MLWQANPFAYAAGVTALLSIGLALYIWQQRFYTPGAAPLSILMLAAGEWSLGYALELSSADLPSALGWAKAEYLGIVAVPLAWLVFSLQYGGHERWLKGKRGRALRFLGLPSLVTLLLVLTNEKHELIWSEVRQTWRQGFALLDLSHGVAFWLWTAYAYGLILIGTLSLLQVAWNTRYQFRQQAILILIAVLTPWIGNVISLAGLNPFPPLDLTPFGLVVTGLALMGGSLRYRLLGIMPIARGVIFETIQDAVIVLDRRGRVVDLNPSAESLLGCRLVQVIGLPANEVLSRWPGLLEHHQRVKGAGEGVIVPLDSQDRSQVFELRMSSLPGERGRLLLLHDITQRKRAEEALQRRVDELTILHAVVSQAVNASSVDELVEGVTQIIGQRLYPDHFGFLLLDESGQELRIHPSYRGLPPHIYPMRVSLEKGVTGRCVRTGLVQRIPDVTKDPEFVEVTPGIRSELCVPIQSERRIYGVINAESRIPDAFSEDDERFLTTVSAQIATALERIHLFEAAQQRAEEQYLLFSAAREFSSALDQEAVLYTIARHMVKLLHAPDCAILRWERSADQLVTLLDYDTALPNRGDAPGTVYSLADYPASREVLLSRKPLIVRLDDLEADPAERAILERYNYAAMLMLPLIAGSEAFGLIELYRESGAPAFMPSEVQLAQSLAAQAAIALENARLHHQVKKLAITDDLTGLFNRRHLFELGAREVQRARRFGRPLSAIMLDIDDFKAVNDTHGHAVGDEVLREVARRCAASLREIDIFGRYGGDEFAGFLPESSLSVAEQVAERLRASVSKEPFCPQEGLQLHLTISVGVASLESGLYDAATLLSHADLALYAAKQKGRNGMATFPITP